MLYLIATPIGNLGDITLRSLDTLREVNGIICEDTRRSSLLLNHYQIDKPLIVLNDFNESKNVPLILARLKSGENLALVSDAGTPLVSDPGYKLVREAIKEGVVVDSLPGPSSVITALTLSTLPSNSFMFLGYPPDKPGHRKDLWKKIKLISDINPTTFILFVAPFKIIKTLQEIQESLGDLEVVLAKELTKIHQSVEIKIISEWLNFYKNKQPKGEFVLLFNIKSI